MNRTDSVKYKVDCIRHMLKKQGYDALEIQSQANFSFVTGGRGFIGLASTAACASLFITPEKVVLVSENIESDRLYTEQLDRNPIIEKRAYPWDVPQKRHEIVNELTKNLKLATEQEVATELFNLRTIMTPYDTQQLERLSLETAKILESICKELVPGITDYGLAGEISKALWAHNIEPITLLIGFDERALAYRHPVMHGAVLKNYALVGVCARRNGLIVSISRDVLIEADPVMIDKHVKCAHVHATFMDGLQIGRSLGRVYQEAVAVYAEQGYPQEETLHHQGGLTGFVPRELKAVARSQHVIRENEVYAFNPTLQGAKVEDTVLVTGQGLKNLTHTGTYCYLDVEVNNTTYTTPTVYVIKK